LIIELFAVAFSLLSLEEFVFHNRQHLVSAVAKTQLVDLSAGIVIHAFDAVDRLALKVAQHVTVDGIEDYAPIF